MHTTRDSELVKLDAGGYLADTPGIRTLTIWDVEPEELDAYYRDIAPFVPECRFTGLHAPHRAGLRRARRRRAGNGSAGRAIRVISACATNWNRLTRCNERGRLST